jgi:hypothetical protein
MTLYLRDKNNNTIVDIELSKGKEFVDIRVAIDIKQYSNLLLNNLDRKGEVIGMFDSISNLRGWLWEDYTPRYGNKPSSYKDIKALVMESLTDTARMYGLTVVED